MIKIIGLIIKIVWQVETFDTKRKHWPGPRAN